jgi:hypothetical protein
LRSRPAPPSKVVIDQNKRAILKEGTKTRRSRRTVRLTVGLVAALRDHRRRQLEERLRFRAEFQDRGLVSAAGWTPSSSTA